MSTIYWVKSQIRIVKNDIERMSKNEHPRAAWTVSILERRLEELEKELEAFGLEVKK